MNMGVYMLLLVGGSIAAGVYMFAHRGMFFPPAVKHNRRPAAPAGVRRRAPAGALAAGGQRSASVQRSHARVVRSPHPSARSASVQRSAAERSTPATAPLHVTDAALDITAKELTQLAQAITLKAGGATKQVALETAFDVTKGASQGWRRAVTLYDLATRPAGAVAHEEQNTAASA